MMDHRTFTTWRKSHRSDAGDNCVQVAFAADGSVGVRDSKNPTGDVLTFTPTAWETFTGAVRDGEFDTNVQ
jgi:hypothetical protein